MLCAALVKLHLPLLLPLLSPPSSVISLPLGPDKLTKQGENGALYWDACQGSPWIYGQQTAFITQAREAEGKEGVAGGKTQS